MEIARCGRERRQLIHEADMRLASAHQVAKTQCGGFLRSQVRAASRFEMASEDYRAVGLSLSALSSLREAYGIWMLIDDPERLKTCREMIDEINQERQTDVWPTIDDDTT
ncbi:MAG: hypothetical protein RLZZ326_2422 [Planctomycetota bacterium]